MSPPRLSKRFQFQSTHPTRGCDVFISFRTAILIISIHAPHEGVRLAERLGADIIEIFQSTHPTRGCDRNML